MRISTLELIVTFQIIEINVQAMLNSKIELKMRVVPLQKIHYRGNKSTNCMKDKPL